MGFGSLFTSEVVVRGHCLVTLSFTFNETLKWLSSLPTLMQESFWWWHRSDRYIISFFHHLHTPFTRFSPSLISLMVSVDVKHHVYFLLFDLFNAVYRETRTEPPGGFWLLGEVVVGVGGWNVVVGPGGWNVPFPALSPPFCIKIGWGIGHFNVSVTVRHKVTRQCLQMTIF